MPGKNGGTLKRGGVNPNAGRRPSAVRKRALALFVQNLPALAAIAAGVTVEIQDDGSMKLKSPNHSAQVSAMKLLGELGMGEQVAVSEVKARMRQQVDVLREELPPELFERVAQRLTEVWS
jgi:hypothetical protein